MNISKALKQDKAVFLQNAGLYIFAAALPFSVSLIQGGILLFIAAGLWRRYRPGNIKSVPSELRGNPLFLPWLAYLGAGLLAAIFGAAPGHSLTALNSDLLTVVVFAGLCLFLEPERREAALKIYLAALTAAAAFGIWQSLTALLSGLDVRAHAAVHPVRFGEMMVIGLSLALARISAPPASAPGSVKSIYAAAFTILSAIVLSQTRSAYLATGLVFASLLLIRRPPKRVIFIFILAGLLLAAALSLMNPAIGQKIFSIRQGFRSAISASEMAPDRSIGTRRTLWKAGLAMIQDRPLLGAGPGGVKKLFLRYVDGPPPEGKVWGSLHNLYIHQAAERGLVGLAALLALFSGMFLVSLRNFRASPSELTLWPLAIMPAWFLMNFTEISFQHVHTSYAVLFALAVSFSGAKVKQPPL